MNLLKKMLICLLTLALLSSNVCTVFAAGEGNVDGGGGDLGGGSNTNKWRGRDDGIRVTIVQADNGAVVSKSIDLTNATPKDIKKHFKKKCKIDYCKNGASLTPNTGKYTYINPSQRLPQIINIFSTDDNIERIKNYFTDEQVIQAIAKYCDVSFDELTSGKYKIFLEPLAYVTFEGTRTAMTATEAALYDQMLGGLMYRRLTSLSHKNLPLSLFLETPDLGFPAWSGPKTQNVSDEVIISSLGLGIVRFNDQVTPPEVETIDYTYRVNTDVITSVNISGGQSDPDHPVQVTFQIGGVSYPVGNVYYPENGSQLAWVKWRTPSTPQTVLITVYADGKDTGKSTLKAKIVDLSSKDPPNPVADDRKDSYSPAKAIIPNKAEKTSAHWGIWKPRWKEHWVWKANMVYYPGSHNASCSPGCGSAHGYWVDRGKWVDEGWWEFDLYSYNASLTASMQLRPDEKSPTAIGEQIKSGYGVNITVNAKTISNQSSAVTGAQTAISYFPEFYYKKYWRLLDLTQGGFQPTFQFKSNKYSTYRRRTHFTPIWMPDGAYTVYTYLLDCWTPDGMLSTNLTDSVQISGNLWSDWHIAPVN